MLLGAISILVKIEEGLCAYVALEGQSEISAFGRIHGEVGNITGDIEKNLPSLFAVKCLNSHQTSFPFNKTSKYCIQV